MSALPIISDRLLVSPPQSPKGRSCQRAATVAREVEATWQVVGERGISLATAFWALLALELLALLSAPSVLLRRRGQPVAALAWLLALVGLPGLGSVAWWAFGRNTLERRRRKVIRKKRSFAEQVGAPPATHGTRFDSYVPPRARGEAIFASRGNRVQLLSDGVSYFQALERALSSAQRTIYLQMYIFRDDRAGRRILELLTRCAEDGVRVRVLLDGFGSQDLPIRVRRRLRAASVELAFFLPSHLSPLQAPRFNFVNHRKIVVIDEQIAFTGGMNVANEYVHEWQDLMIQVEGPAVRSLHHVLLDDWYFATNQAIEPESEPSPADVDGCDLAVVASGPDSEPWIHDAYFLAITEAQQRVYLATPYFIPSPALLAALRTADGRGVDVRVILPSRSDVNVVKWASRSYYRELVWSGVRIFEYQGAMLHAKALVSDHDIASVGTANVDSRSFFGLSFEVTCFMASAALSEQVEQWMQGLLAQSVEVTLSELDRKSTGQKLLESAAHLFSPIL